MTIPIAGTLRWATEKDNILVGQAYLTSSRLSTFGLWRSSGCSSDCRSSSTSFLFGGAHSPHDFSHQGFEERHSALLPPPWSPLEAGCWDNRASPKATSIGPTPHPWLTRCRDRFVEGFLEIEIAFVKAIWFTTSNFSLLSPGDLGMDAICPL